MQMAAIYKTTAWNKHEQLLSILKEYEMKNKGITIIAIIKKIDTLQMELNKFLQAISFLCTC